MFLSIFTGGIAHLRVGPDEVPFDAHSEVLCNISPFFKAALNRDWTEARTKLIALPDEDPDAFTLFLRFAYTGSPLHDDEKTTTLNLSRLWVMADKYQVPR
ncbi:BTB/POZ protein [Clohesyomyces aquaticus]|uniref:BTB/POZ protein n=1 Tax=Clohesyomyces aquaticus TaxID=1231657 RepID=A0A1Y1ZIA9_9PLEO|nr:BTB/POZ protein [Clohesyomyces aquaticus]